MSPRRSIPPSEKPSSPPRKRKRALPPDPANFSPPPDDEAVEAEILPPEEASAEEGWDPEEDLEIREDALLDDAAPTLADRVSEDTSLVRLPPLQRYLADIRRYPLLTREEEHALAVRYFEEEEVEVAQKLVTANLRLVVKIALEYQKYWMNLLDLVQEGNVGLMQAVKHYDPYRGVKLSSYASFWIKAYILKFIIDNWSLVRIGTTQAQRKLFFNLKREKERYALLGYDASPARLAQDMNVKPELVVEMEQRMAGGDISLDQPINHESEDRPIDFVADRQPAIDQQLADDEIQRIFRKKLQDFRATLQDKDLYIFDHRLMSEEPETLNEIGDRFRISRERVRQLEERLMRNLKAFMHGQVPELSDVGFEIGAEP